MLQNKFNNLCAHTLLNTHNVCAHIVKFKNVSAHINKYYIFIKFLLFVYSTIISLV